MAGLAVKLPLSRNNKGGYSLIQTYDELAAQNLKMLVLTCPGERIMDPEFGVGARRFLFENMGQSTFRSFEVRLRQQQQKYLPYLKIENIEFLTSEVDQTLGDNFLGIRISYFNKVTNIRNALSLPINN